MNKKILVVEDNREIITLISIFLKNYEISSAFSGEEALTAFQMDDFDAVLMDINLGRGWDGLETTKKIKSMPNYHNQPIIAVTAHALKGDRERILKEGCSHYIPKPFKREDLTNCLNTALIN